MIFHKVFQELLTELRNSPADNPVRELRLLSGHVLGMTYEQLLFDPPFEIGHGDVEALRQLVKRRCQHEPLAKILGYKEFWGLKFKVTADTLDPRPDSEVLIETALRNIPDHQASVQLLDLGTGSGCLLLSLLAGLPNAHGVGVDVSMAALKVAQENAQTLGLTSRSQFIQSDWLEQVQGVFDLIIANPPYIDRSEVLSRETLYDPESALFAANQGLADYRAILQSARTYLKPQGIIVLEVGYAQADAVINIACENQFKLLSCVKDLNGLDRCLVFS